MKRVFILTPHGKVNRTKIITKTTDKCPWKNEQKRAEGRHNSLLCACEERQTPVCTEQQILTCTDLYKV